jgi:anti-sigma regulatory factor (Ser/Thr protein kinase)
MEGFVSATEPFAIRVEDKSHASAARAAAQGMARGLGFDETLCEHAAIVATEAVTNIVKHAHRGTFVGRVLSYDGAVGIEMLAIDSGPGMASFQASARDGTSTKGTSGTGLGAIGRLSSELDTYTHPGGGTVLRIALWNRESIPRCEYEVGAIMVPKDGETVCGDAWAVERHSRGATFLVADGLGHGPDASRAAASAVDVLHRHPEDDAIRILDLAHAKLRATRGAAVAVIRHDMVAGEATFAGIGNISACVLNGSERRAMVSHNGILGHNVPRAQEFHYGWPADALFVAHSDGLQSQWSLAAYPGLADCHPSIIAGLLYRDHSRGRDDVTVVVARGSRRMQ